MRHERRAALAVVLGALLAARPAAAQVSRTSAGDRAQRLLAECNRQIESGQCEAALQQCKDAYAVYPAPDLLLNVAEAYRCMGRYDDGVGVLDELLSHPGQSRPATLQAAQAARERMNLLRGSRQQPRPSPPIKRPPLSQRDRQRLQKQLAQCNAELDQHRCEAASRTCADLYADYPAPLLLMNLAAAYECRGQVDVAVQILEQFLADADGSQQQVEADAQKTLVRLRAQLPALVKRQQVRIEWTPAAATLLIDRRPVGAGGAAEVELTEGEHAAHLEEPPTPGWRAADFVLLVRQGMAQPVKWALERQAAVEVEGPLCQYLLDGEQPMRLTGHSGPLRFRAEVTAGVHRVGVRCGKEEPRWLMLQVNDGDVARLAMRRGHKWAVAAGSALLGLGAGLAAASAVMLYLDGRPYGCTPEPGGHCMQKYTTFPHAIGALVGAGAAVGAGAGLLGYGLRSRRLTLVALLPSGLGGSVVLEGAF